MKSNKGQILEAMKSALSALESLPELISAAGDRNKKAQDKLRAAIEIADRWSEEEGSK